MVTSLLSPHSSAPDLCRLLNLWSGGIYGEIDDAKLVERGLTLILEDTDLSTIGNGASNNEGSGAGDDSDAGQQQLKEMTRESWEVGSRGGGRSAGNRRFCLFINLIHEMLTLGKGYEFVCQGGILVV